MNWGTKWLLNFAMQNGRRWLVLEVPIVSFFDRVWPLWDLGLLGKFTTCKKKFVFESMVKWPSPITLQASCCLC